MAACKKNKKIPNINSPQHKKATVTNTQSTKMPKWEVEGDSYYEKTPVWAFSKSDFKHNKWGLETNNDQLLRIIKKLKDYEGMSWRQILSDTAGRRAAPKNSEKNITQIIDEAQDRFQELNLLYEHDSIYSLTVDGAVRLWGVRTSNIFYIIWIDPEHEIYPVGKSHT